MMNNKLRIYDINTKQHDLYKQIYKNQSYKHVCNKLRQYKNLNNTKMTMITALSLLDNFIDPSDPDVDVPNSIHAYQTAERIRKTHPNNIEFQVCGLIHDIGKVLFSFNEPSYNVVGDTYIVGVEFPKTIVYYDDIKENPDFNNELLNSKYGIYQAYCGLDNVKISFGHDEYLFKVLTSNTNHLFPYKYSKVIRYHSLYPWHSCNEYRHLMNHEDYYTLKNVTEFNKFDLYSKEDTDFILTDKIKKYYNTLLQHFFPEELYW